MTLITALFIANGLGLAAVVWGLLAQRRFNIWVETQLAEREQDSKRGFMAHGRIAKIVRALDLRVPKRRHPAPPLPSFPIDEDPFPLSRPAEDWDEGDYDTRKLNGAETFLPVDFRHDLW